LIYNQIGLGPFLRLKAASFFFIYIPALCIVLLQYRQQPTIKITIASNSITTVARILPDRLASTSTTLAYSVYGI
jgi:hypothetical protein